MNKIIRDFCEENGLVIKSFYGGMRIYTPLNEHVMSVFPGVNTCGFYVPYTNQAFRCGSSELLRALVAAYAGFRIHRRQVEECLRKQYEREVKKVFFGLEFELSPEQAEQVLKILRCKGFKNPRVKVHVSC